MTVPRPTTPRRVGRPPATNSVETRRRVLEVARAAFAEQGWELTTNKYVSAKAGITAAALYHYFDSKLAMFVAVFDDVEAFVDARFDEAVAHEDTFSGQFRGVLEAAYAMNAADPSLARFMGSARVDIARHSEVRRAIQDHRGPGRFLLEGLISTGIATGEIKPDRRTEVAAFIRTVLVGLNDAVSHDLREQRAAIDGIIAVLEGRLLGPAKKAAAQPTTDKATTAKQGATKASTSKRTARSQHRTR